MAKKDAFIIRDFNDATPPEQRFTGGTIVAIEDGQFLNYEAGGLVREPTDGDRAKIAAAQDKPEPTKAPAAAGGKDAKPGA